MSICQAVISIGQARLCQTVSGHVRSVPDRVGPIWTVPRRRPDIRTSLVEPNAQVESEFYGGEQLNDPEDEELTGSEGWRPERFFNHNELVNILSRSAEITAGGRKGRKKAAHVQMKMFDDRFHTELNTPVPANSVNLQELQLSYVRVQSVNNAFQYHDAVVKWVGAARHWT